MAKCQPCNGSGKSFNPSDDYWKCAECAGTGIKPGKIRIPSGEGFSWPECRVVRVDVSPMNPKIKIAQLTCGHDAYRNRKPRIGALIVCDKCAKVGA